MEIVVTSRYDVLRKLQEAEFPFQSLISINDPGDSVPDFSYSHTGTLLPMFLYDIPEDVPGFDAPTKQQVREIIEYAQNEFFHRNSTRMLIHCHAGISRSSAAAIIVAKTVGLDVPAFISQLCETNNIHPNPRMISLAGEFFGNDFFEQVREQLESSLEWGWHHGQEE